MKNSTKSSMHKKKDILFVMNNLNVGGAEKALVSMLLVFDYEKYNVDLLLFKKEGLFLKHVPQEVNILDEPENYRYFDMPFLRVVKENFFTGRWNNILRRIQFMHAVSRAQNAAEAEQFGWRALSKALKPLSKKYDVAIGFLEKNPNYFVVDKVTADKKLGYIHSDYVKLMMNKDLDQRYFKTFDKILTVSHESKNILCSTFPEYHDKFILIRNIVSQNVVKKLAEYEIVLLKKNAVISVGRLSAPKNYALAIAAFKILYDKGIKFTWYILGSGEQEDDLKSKIKKLGFIDHVNFLGVKENPYPYIKSADVFLLTSEFEGDGIVVRESKILAKPIILTDFSTAQSHITNGENGMIVQMSAHAVANALEKLLTDLSLREKFSDQLSCDDFGTEQEIYKLYQLIEG